MLLPYSGKFSRGPIFVGPIFADRQSSKISRSNFHRWPFQNCSAHNTWLTPPLTACVCWLKLAEKLVKDRRRNGTRVIYDRGYGLWWLSELSLVSITRFTSVLADSMDDDGHCRRQRAAWIRKLGSIARHLK